MFIVPPMAGEPDAVTDLCELVNHPRVVEVLDALSHGSTTFRELRALLGTRRRALVAALRVVGARGLVTRTENGSWDNKPPDDTVFRLSELGGQILAELSRFSVWTAMYDRIEAGWGHSWNR